MIRGFATAFAAGMAVALVRERRKRQIAERVGAATMETLLNAIDANDSVTGAHVRRVAATSLVVAGAAGLNERECRNIERVALFHDIGKIHEALFDILHDADQLTPAERRAVARHPEVGSKVLQPLQAFYPELREGVLAHHERWDGTGYPQGLKGDRIPLSARIVALADTFDAITQSRRYHDAKSDETAVAAILEGRGTQFDPALVDLFVAPPVLVQIRQARRGAHAARRASREQRRASPAPDVTFRWRTTAPERRPRVTR